MDFNIASPAISTTQPNPFPVTVPFAWEHKPGVPNPFYKFLEQDFAFDVSGEFSCESVSAEELFDGGVIKFSEMKTDSSPSSFSSFSGLSASTRRRTQSFSTRRGWEVPWEEPQEKEKQESPTTKNIKPDHGASSFPMLSASSSAKGSRKWRLRDLFLFRSASDGRAMDQDPLKKYSGILRKHDEDFMKSCTKSIEPQTRPGSSSGSKRKEAVSAHELHYKINRAVANEMKKKTFLPYKQGILGRSAVNPSVHALSNGFGVSTNNRE
ncbi:hypothetical protein QVD17_39160 [Tagetes erecta]|uniref:Uncharacterized protein n=1 Tax=Tagetes erecta TaxID=13708 RepID=A0AAD8JN30_TARER|nr:hypothetical protein QVD17_39160 [Tagetes erecta]